MNNNEDITVFAQTNFRNQQVKFGIKRDDRRRHMYLIGKTGMGKSNTLENMVISDIQAGNGVCLVDPHGDAAEKILNFIPSSRINDVVYFNPADVDNPIAFNILESIDPSKKHLVASGLIAIFKKLWADSWGPRLEYLLRNGILALLDYQGSTLLGITRMLTNKPYRNRIVEKITDPVVKSFWQDEYSKYPDRFQTEAIAPIQNKVGQFLSNSLIRNIIGQVKSTIDMREIMDNKKILIANLSKGRIGEDTSALLGAMVITKLYLAAMSRVDILEEERQDFYVYVDEFQNFATESFANILSEARKYRLNLIIAHQYIEQLDEKVASAVFGNVGTIMTFRVGATDAEMLAKEFAPHILEEDLVSLTKYTIYLKLMIDGVASDPFSAMTLPPISGITDHRDTVIRVSRERYSHSRQDVEDKIARWAEGVTEIGNESAKSPEKNVPAKKPLKDDFTSGKLIFEPKPFLKPTTRVEASASQSQQFFNPSPSPQSFKSPQPLVTPRNVKNIFPVNQRGVVASQPLSSSVGKPIPSPVVNRWRDVPGQAVASRQPFASSQPVVNNQPSKINPQLVSIPKIIPPVVQDQSQSLEQQPDQPEEEGISLQHLAKGKVVRF